MYDMLGIIKDFYLCFLCCYFEFFDVICGVIEVYIEDVKAGYFFSDKEQYQIWIGGYYCNVLWQYVLYLYC